MNENPSGDLMIMMMMNMMQLMEPLVTVMRNVMIKAEIVMWL